MPKDNAPVIGGAGGGIFAWFQDTFFMQAVPTFMGEIMQVALFAFIGAGIGEGVKLLVGYLKKEWDKKEKPNG